MGVYKEKKINKKKDFPDEINQLFKINQRKNIVSDQKSVQREIIPEPIQEPEPIQVD